jgi:hypothetical protein
LAVTVVIFDFYAEVMGAESLLSAFEKRGSGENGGFSLQATFTQIFFDARAPVEGGINSRARTRML